MSIIMGLRIGNDGTFIWINRQGMQFIGEKKKTKIEPLYVWPSRWEMTPQWPLDYLESWVRFITLQLQD